MEEVKKIFNEYVKDKVGQKGFWGRVTLDVHFANGNVKECTIEVKKHIRPSHEGHVS